MVSNEKEIRTRYVFRKLTDFQGRDDLACIYAIQEVREYGHIESSVVKALYLPHDPITLNGYAYFKLATESDPTFPAYLRLRYRKEIGTLYEALAEMYTFQANFTQHVEVTFDILEDYELWSEKKYRAALKAEQERNRELFS